MGEIEEVYGLWRNLEHPYIAVDDTALAIIKFKNGGIGNILVSNSQKPEFTEKCIFTAKTGRLWAFRPMECAMFIAGMSNVLEPPVNDLWTVPGEEKQLKKWIRKDTEFFNTIDPVNILSGTTD